MIVLAARLRVRRGREGAASTRSCSAGIELLGRPAAGCRPPPRGRRCRAPSRAAPRPATSAGRVDAPGRRDARSRAGRSRGSGRCRSRARSRSASRAARASRPRRGSTSPRRRRPRSRPARASRGRPTRPSVSRAVAVHAAEPAGGEHAGCPPRAARCAVAATVVAPCPPRAATGARSRTPHLTTSSAAPRPPAPSSSRPMRASPATTAIVAGTAPPARTAASTSCATSRLRGRGRPWLIERALERHHRPPAGQRVGHLRGDPHAAQQLQSAWRGS